MNKVINTSIPSTPKALAEAKAVVAQPVTAKPNARAHIRTLFASVGAVATKDQVLGIVRDAKGAVIDPGYHNVTINTHLTDLKNPKYAGKLGCINVVRQTDGTFIRLPDSKKAEPIPNKKLA